VLLSYNPGSKSSKCRHLLLLEGGKAMEVGDTRSTNGVLRWIGICFMSCACHRF
jgi:hypothetical protein